MSNMGCEYHRRTEHLTACRCRGAIARGKNDCFDMNLQLAFSVLLRYQPHMSIDSMDKLAKALAEAVPQGLRSVSDDLEKNFRGVLQSGIGKLDLVTREEFDVQESVLARTREKLEALEARLANLESAASKPVAKIAQRKNKRRKVSKKASKKT
jgi:BMFP domain-containing protein YqiC